VETTESRTGKVFVIAKGEYETCEGQNQLPMSLSRTTCVCGQWQICGIPYGHATRAILYSRESPKSYV